MDVAGEDDDGRRVRHRPQEGNQIRPLAGVVPIALEVPLVAVPRPSITVRLPFEIGAEREERSGEDNQQRFPLWEGVLFEQERGSSRPSAR